MRYLPGLILAAALMWIGSASGALAEKFMFDVYRKGDKIGTHTITLDRQGNRTKALIEIELEVKIAFITVFKYSHRNEEVWEGDQLVSLKTVTNDDGEKFAVTASRRADGIWVEGWSGKYLAPRDALPTSYWNIKTVEAKEFIDTQRGRLMKMVTKPEGQEKVETPAGGTLTAKKFDMVGDLDVTLWYAPDGRWAKLGFVIDGAPFDYKPVNPS